MPAAEVLLLSMTYPTTTVSYIFFFFLGLVSQPG
jgi:hypothetical protein